MTEIYPHIQNAGLDQNIRNIVLHYIDGKIEIEIFINEKQVESVLESLKNACKTCSGVRSINIHQQL